MAVKRGEGGVEAGSEVLTAVVIVKYFFVGDFVCSVILQFWRTTAGKAGKEGMGPGSYA